MREDSGREAGRELVVRKAALGGLVNFLERGQQKRWRRSLGLGLVGLDSGGFGVETDENIGQNCESKCQHFLEDLQGCL